MSQIYATLNTASVSYISCRECTQWFSYSQICASIFTINFRTPLAPLRQTVYLLTRAARLPHTPAQTRTPVFSCHLSLSTSVALDLLILEILCKLNHITFIPLKRLFRSGCYSGMCPSLLQSDCHLYFFPQIQECRSLVLEADLQRKDEKHLHSYQRNGLLRKNSDCLRMGRNPTKRGIFQTQFSSAPSLNKHSTKTETWRQAETQVFCFLPGKCEPDGSHTPTQF